MKNVMLIHGYNGIPQIFTYFKEKLEEKGYNVIIPEFPTRTDITIEGYFEIFDKYKEYFNENLIVIAHSIGNVMLIKYICKNSYKIDSYISLAGFGVHFIVEGKDDLNKVIAPLEIISQEKSECINLIKNRYSIYSNNDHIVPFTVLEDYTNIINSTPILIEGIGHMGKKSGLKELPKVIEIIDNMEA